MQKKNQINHNNKKIDDQAEIEDDDNKIIEE